MANMKPPISALKKKLDLLEGVPGNTPQQLEPDRDVFRLFGGVHICTAGQRSQEWAERSVRRP